MADEGKAWNLDKEQAACCKQQTVKSYNPDDVTTWTNEEFQSKTAAKLRNYWNKLETIKFMLRDGKVWVAGEQLQGLSDGIGFLVNLLEQRIENGEGSKSNANSH